LRCLGLIKGALAHPLTRRIAIDVYTRNLMPAWSFWLWRGIENALSPYNDKLAMFAHVVLRRT
jgi:hypothetical protein